MAENKEKLFDQFPPVSYDEWRKKVETDLKGADFDKKLVWRTNEGFNVQPIYRIEDIEGMLARKSSPKIPSRLMPTHAMCSLAVLPPSDSR